MRHSLVCNILTDTRLHNHRAPIYRTAMSVIAMVCMLLPLPLLLLSPLLMTRTNDDERRRPYYYKIFALLHRMNKSGSSVIRFALIFWCVCALCCIYKLHKSNLSSSLSLSFCFLISLFAGSLPLSHIVFMCSGFFIIFNYVWCVFSSFALRLTNILHFVCRPFAWTALLNIAMQLIAMNLHGSLYSRKVYVGHKK